MSIKKKFCLDAGHYGKYNRSPAVGSYYESEMNWKLHLKVKAELEKYKDVEVILTREDQSKDMDLYARGRCAKGCVAFLSYHSNATVGNVIKEDIDYPVVYVPISGVADELGNKLAKCIQQTMGTKQAGYISSKQSTKGPWDWYGVIYGAVEVGVPGLILEHSFHTNTRSTKWLLDDSNLDKLAAAEAKVIAEYYQLEKDEDKEIYRVISGAYTIQENAKNQLMKVRGIYPEAIMIKSGEYYKVQVSAYETSIEARRKMIEVKSKGIDCYISIDSQVEIIVGHDNIDDYAYTHKKFVEDIQRAFGATVDGIPGPETLGKTLTISATVNRKHNAVRHIQNWLLELGYDEIGKADGIAGSKFTAGVKHYQRDHDCTSDGEITAKNKTWKSLLGLI